MERATRLAGAGNLTEDRGRELIAEIVEHATGEAPKFYSADEWLREWVAGKRLAKADGTVVKYKHTIDRFLVFVGAKAKRNVNQITPRDILQFRNADVAAGKHATTCNQSLKHLRMAFTAARRQGLITHNPAEAVEMLRSNEEAEKGTFTAEQVGALLHAAPTPDWQGIIMVSFYTGARLQDAANLRAGAVDVANRTLSFRARKTSKLVTVPIHPQLLARLESLASTVPTKTEFLFPSLAGKTAGGRSGLSMAFSRIMVAAGIEGDIARPRSGLGRTVRTLTFHSLRHSFNSIMANSGVSQELRQKLTGHASAETNKRYTHHELSQLNAAIATLPSVS